MEGKTQNGALTILKTLPRYKTQQTHTTQTLAVEHTWRNHVFYIIASCRLEHTYLFIRMYIYISIHSHARMTCSAWCFPRCCDVVLSFDIEGEPCIFIRICKPLCRALPQKHKRRYRIRLRYCVPPPPSHPPQKESSFVPQKGTHFPGAHQFWGLTKQTCLTWTHVHSFSPTHTQFAYLPGVEYLRVEIWNKNVMADNYIARAWISLADAFRCTRKPGHFSYDLFRWVLL